MCNSPKCMYVDILEMTNGEMLYVHYDTNLVPLFFQFYDAERNIETEYQKVSHPSLFIEEDLEEVDLDYIPVETSNIKLPPQIEIVSAVITIDDEYVRHLS